MKIGQIIFATLLALICLNSFAAELICGSATRMMKDAVDDLNAQLAKRIGISITAPVFHEQVNTAYQDYRVCVSANTIVRPAP